MFVNTSQLPGSGRISYVGFNGEEKTHFVVPYEPLPSDCPPVAEFKQFTPEEVEGVKAFQAICQKTLKKLDTEGLAAKIQSIQPAARSYVTYQLAISAVHPMPDGRFISYYYSTGHRQVAPVAWPKTQETLLAALERCKVALKAYPNELDGIQEFSTKPPLVNTSFVRFSSTIHAKL